MGHFAPEPQPTWEAITLARFLRQLPPQIELIYDAGDRPLRWVEPSDMDDPTDYLMANELILTSGFPLLEHVEDQVWVDQFIARLVQAQTSALGFGLEPYFTSVPKTVRIACERHGLTLLQIPATVPFAAIGIAFAKLMEADGAAALRSNAEANRALMRCVSQPDPTQQLITTLAQRLNASVKLLDTLSDTRVSAAIAAVIDLDTDTEQQLVQQALQTTGRQPLAVHHHQSQVHLAFPVRAAISAGGQVPPFGVLCVGFPRVPSAFDHHLIATALGLLELLAREQATSSPSATQLATALLLRSRTALDAQTLQYLAESVGHKQSRLLRAVVIAPLRKSQPAQSSFHLVLIHSLLDTHLVLEQGEHFVALSTSEPTKQLYERLRSGGYLAGFSTPHPIESEVGEQLADLLAQATGLLPQMLERQQSLDAQSIPRSFASLLPPRAGKQLAEEMLAPILELDDSRSDLYLMVLRGWLDANGSWDQASKNIDMHRNSVRRHITTITQLLGKDLNQAQVRHELYLAMNFLNSN